jgi:hypothetical protein
MVDLVRPSLNEALDENQVNPRPSASLQSRPATTIFRKRLSATFRNLIAFFG